ncbi:MAG TPA: gamma-glutamylcyclotransferase family protein [Opitutaceae bacterium]|nr:gamma-glutamylcyclotransferase family protein [Opitutaceae bacterium]
MTSTLYFAYGSNMNEEQLKMRCTTSHFLCRAVLAEHRFVITSRGYASVVPHAGGKAHGVLIALTAPDERALDRYEGVAAGMYRRATVEVITELGYAVPALIYIDDIGGEGPPKPDYLERILDGARRHALPQESVAELEGWANAGP